MKSVKVYNLSGEAASEIKLPEFFNTEINEGILHTVATAEMANQRVAIAHTKTRGEISGGGKKPWRQKGSGRARAGSSRSPLWRGGGITFGPNSDQNFAKKLNKKIKKLALAMAYASKAQDETLYIVDSVKFETPKTKFAATLLSKLPTNEGTFIIEVARDEAESLRAFRNISGLICEKAEAVSVVDLLKYKNLVITTEALSDLENIFKTAKKSEKENTEEEKVKTDKKEVEAETEKIVEEKPKATKAKKQAKVTKEA